MALTRKTATLRDGVLQTQVSLVVLPLLPASVSGVEWRGSLHVREETMTSTFLQRGDLLISIVNVKSSALVNARGSLGPSSRRTLDSKRADEFEEFN